MILKRRVINILGQYRLEIYVPEGMSSSFAKFIPAVIKVRETAKERKSGEIIDQDVWFYGNRVTTDIIKQLAIKWQNSEAPKPLKHAMNQFNEAYTRKEFHGPNVNKMASETSDYKVKHLYTMIPKGFMTEEQSESLIKLFAEMLYITLTATSVSNKDGCQYSRFWKKYESFATTKLMVAIDKYKQRRSTLDVENWLVKTMPAMDKYFMDDDINKILCFVFGKTIDELEKEKDILKFGWEKYSKTD